MYTFTRAKANRGVWINFERQVGNDRLTTYDALLRFTTDD